MADADYILPCTTPKFLGYTINDFNLSDGRPNREFAKLMNKIRAEVENELVPKLSSMDMLLKDASYIEANAMNNSLSSMREISKYCIAEISNFNKLIAISNKKSIPIFGLRDEYFEEGQKRTLRWFRSLFGLMANKVIKLTKDA